MCAERSAIGAHVHRMFLDLHYVTPRWRGLSAVEISDSRRKSCRSISARHPGIRDLSHASLAQAAAATAAATSALESILNALLRAHPRLWQSTRANWPCVYETGHDFSWRSWREKQS